MSDTASMRGENDHVYEDVDMSDPDNLKGLGESIDEAPEAIVTGVEEEASVDKEELSKKSSKSPVEKGGDESYLSNQLSLEDVIASLDLSII